MSKNLLDMICLATIWPMAPLTIRDGFRVKLIRSTLCCLRKFLSTLVTQICTCQRRCVYLSLAENSFSQRTEFGGITQIPPIFGDGPVMGLGELSRKLVLKLLTWRA
ncbi:hypothetical protein TBK1r_18440 [Stieleria magnilauensis]|uniref:Uncharacterized protein n=1 Tax=Stieleria magnilauensis TaxID=2527963 RepID=A0ABX5XLQ2_9BACT|nr:hypothetical protein TBK1r_18440 [Planctomycetes bacterium TBK1r]